MSDKSQSVSTSIRVVPFTGALFAIWAFFEPTGYGKWLGQIVSAFRASAGF